MPMLRDLAKGARYDDAGEVVKFGDKAEELAAKLIAAAVAGDRDGVAAVLAIMDRTDGPVEKKVEHSGGIPVRVVIRGIDTP